MLLETLGRIANPRGAARKALSTQGAATFRRFLDKKTALALKSAADCLFEDIAAFGTFASKDFESQFRDWNNIWIGGLPAQLTLMGQSPDRYAAVFGAVYRRVRDVFGAQWAPLSQISFIRRHKGSQTHFPWHIDADAANSIALAGASGCMNVWMPLQEVGRDAPTMEIIPGSHMEMRRRPLLASDGYQFRDHGFATAIGAPATPLLKLGDALACDHYTLHRTQPGDFADVTRTSCEFRFAGPYVETPGSVVDENYPLTRRYIPSNRDAEILDTISAPKASPLRSP